MAEEKEKQELYDFIKELFDMPSVQPYIINQIEYYKEKFTFTYSGMKKALEYFYIIKGNPIEKARGCGIIPYVYNEARTYYYTIYCKNRKNEFVKLDTTEKEVTISNPQGQAMKKKKFSFLEG